MKIFFKWLFLAISLIPTMIYTSLFETNDIKQKQRNFLSFFILVFFITGKTMVGTYINRYGFLFTATGSLLTVIKYLKFDKRYVLGFLESITIFVFIYAFHIWFNKKLEITPEQNIYIQKGIILITLCCFVRYFYSLVKNLKPRESLLENLSIITFVIATVLVIEKSIYAWIFFIIAHLSLGLLQLIQKEKDYWFFLLQSISLIVSIKILIEKILIQ